MFIAGLGTAAPLQRYAQADGWEAVQRTSHCQTLNWRSRAILKKILPARNGISTRHLSRVFADVGTSVPQFVLARRLEAARGLLETTAAGAMTVAAVAHRCGFASAAHFSNAFRARFGERASDVRRRAGA